MKVLHYLMLVDNFITISGYIIKPLRNAHVSYNISIVVCIVKFDEWLIKCNSQPQIKLKLFHSLAESNQTFKTVYLLLLLSLLVFNIYFRVIL